MVAALAVIPRTLERQGAESGGEGPGPAPREARGAAARAGQPRPLMVGVVGIEPAGDGPPHDLQRHLSGGGLDGLEVVEGADADQALDFGAGLRRDRRVEPPLFAGSAGWPASSRASHSRPLTSTNSRTSPRSRWYSAI